MQKKLPTTFFLQILLCALLWGSAFPVIKNSFQELNLQSYGEQLIFAGTRFMLAGLIVLPFCRRNFFSSIKKAPKTKLLIIVLGQTYVQYLCFYYGLKVSSGTLGALLVGTGSFWWIILSPVFNNSAKPKTIHWIILTICSLGIGLAVYSPGAGSGNVKMGAAAFLLATLSGAIAAIFMKQVAPISGSRTTTSFSLFCGGTLLLLTALPYWKPYFAHFSLTTLLVTIYLAFLSAIAFTIWNRLIEKYSVSLLSTYRFLIPLFGVIESTLFISEEKVGPGLIIGGTMILICIVAISKVPE